MLRSLQPSDAWAVAAFVAFARGITAMRADRHEHRTPSSGINATSDWSVSRQGEPRLEELMEDPMMGLIWRRDGLEPVHARQTLRELQAVVRAGRRAA